MVGDAFDRLRRANPVLGDVGAPPIEGVLGRLGEMPSLAPSARRRVAGLIASAVGAAVVVAVAAVSLSTHGRPVGRAAAGGVPRGASQLVSILAVLRRPQTAADQAVPWPSIGRFYDQPVPALTRRVYTFPNGRGLFMVVVTNPTAFGTPPALPARAGDGVALWSLCCNGAGETAATLREHKQLLPEERGVPLAHALYYAYSVVPDGVVRVKWVFNGVRATTAFRPSLTVWAKVENNVAVARVRPFSRPVRSATWYAASGRVIATQAWNVSPRFCRQHRGRCQSYQ